MHVLDPSSEGSCSNEIIDIILSSLFFQRPLLQHHLVSSAGWGGGVGGGGGGGGGGREGGIHVEEERDKKSWLFKLPNLQFPRQNLVFSCLISLFLLLLHCANLFSSFRESESFESSTLLRIHCKGEGEESERQRNSLERSAERAIPLLSFNRHLRQLCTWFFLSVCFCYCARTGDSRRIAHGKLRFYGLSEFGVIRNRAVWTTTKLVLQMAVFQNNRCWFCSAIWGGAVPVPAT